jgi:hypothetical protein
MQQSNAIYTYAYGKYVWYSEAKDDTMRWQWSTNSSFYISQNIPNSLISLPVIYGNFSTAIFHPTWSNPFQLAMYVSESHLQKLWFLKTQLAMLSYIKKTQISCKNIREVKITESMSSVYLKITSASSISDQNWYTSSCMKLNQQKIAYDDNKIKHVWLLAS